MGTAPIETNGNRMLELIERLRQRRALKYASPDDLGNLTVPRELFDEAIVALAVHALNDQDYAGFDEAWNDK